MFEFAYGDWKCCVAPEYGGNLFRLRWKDGDILRFPDHFEQLKETPEIYGFPVLFPPGRIDEGFFQFRGKRYFLPLNEPARNVHLHGLALRRQWTLAERKDKSFTLEMSYGKDAPEFNGYPFPFLLKLQYVFSDTVLEQILTVKNCGTEEMPYGAGFHTAFLNPSKIFIPSRGFWETPKPRLLGTGRKFSWGEGFRADKPFSIADLPHSYNIEAPEGAHSVRLAFDFCTLEYTTDEKFRTWCIWAPDPGCEFITIEPFSCFSGAFNAPIPYNESGVLVLKGGEQSSFRSSFRILPVGTSVEFSKNKGK